MRISLPVAKRKARIEIIPLIDIVFFLLATFVMVSMSMVKNQGLPVNLPKASASAPSAADEQNRPTVVGVTQKGEFFINKEIMTFEQLSSRLSSMKSSNSDLRVLVQGDERASFGDAIRVLDEARRLGITKVTIQTRSKES